MQKKNKFRRIVNFRSFLIIAVVVMTAILCVRVNVWQRGVGTALFSMALGLLTIFTVISFVWVYRNAKRKKLNEKSTRISEIAKKYDEIETFAEVDADFTNASSDSKTQEKRIYGFINNWQLYKSVALVIAILLALAAGLHFHFLATTDDFVCPDTLHIVSGRVDDVNYSLGRFTLDDLRIDGELENGRILVFVDLDRHPDLYAVTAGDYLIFSSYLRANRFIRDDGSVNSHALRTGIRYRVYNFYEQVVAVEKGEAAFFSRIHENMRHNLTLAMGSEYGSVALGMITGDRTGIAPEVRDAYSASGLAHILAISGLHVGFLSLTLMKLFKLMRIKKQIGNFIVIGVLFFYAFFVGFSAPIVRAVVMASIMILAYTFSKKYDPLNALGLAMTGILVFAPFFLFDAGFLFSVSALSGIIFFSKPINNFLLKMRVPRFIAKKLSLSIAAQIGIIPSMIFVFESIQIYSIFINLLVHPIISIGFMAIFTTLLLSMIFPSLIVLLQFSGMFIALIDSVAMGAARLPSALLFVAPIAGSFIFLSYFLYFLSSRFFMFFKSKKGRKIFTSVMMSIAVAIAFIGIPLTPRVQNDAAIVPISATRDVTSVVVHESRTYIIGDFRNFFELQDTLRRLNIRQVDAIFLTELSTESANTLIRFAGRFRFSVVKTYIGEIDANALASLAQNNINNFFAFCGLYMPASDILPIIQNGRLLGYELLTANGNIIFVGNRVQYTRICNFILDRAFVIRANSFLGEYDDRIFLTNVPRRPFGQDFGYPNIQFSNADLGRFLFDFRSGAVYALSR